MRLQLQDACFAYPGASHRHVLDRVCLEFDGAPAGITAVVGPNGAGKSTLLRLMLGMLRPTAGAVRWGDTSAHRLSPAHRARHAAYLSQQPLVSTGFSVREVVSLGRFAVGASEEGVFRAMERLDILDRADDPFATLSAGQQQRASIARALAQLDPGGRAPLEGRFLLADEPFSALDPAHAGTVCRVFRESADAGVSVVVVLHDLTTAARLADRVVMLDASGKLAASGSPGSTLTPENLKQVFGVGFELLHGVGGPVVVREDTAAHARI